MNCVMNSIYLLTAWTTDRHNELRVREIWYIIYTIYTKRDNILFVIASQNDDLELRRRFPGTYITYDV